MVDLHSSREAGSAQGPPSATERRECKSRVTLLLRDADSGQIDHMAAEPTHGPHHPCTSSSWLGDRGTLLAIGNVSLIFVVLLLAFHDAPPRDPQRSAPPGGWCSRVTPPGMDTQARYT